MCHIMSKSIMGWPWYGCEVWEGQQASIFAAPSSRIQSPTPNFSQTCLIIASKLLWYTELANEKSASAAFWSPMSSASSYSSWTQNCPDPTRPVQQGPGSVLLDLGHRYSIYTVYIHRIYCVYILYCIYTSMFCVASVQNATLAVILCCKMTGADCTLK